MKIFRAALDFLTRLAFRNKKLERFYQLKISKDCIAYSKFHIMKQEVTDLRLRSNAVKILVKNVELGNRNLDLLCNEINKDIYLSKTINSRIKRFISGIQLNSIESNVQTKSKVTFNSSRKVTFNSSRKIFNLFYLNILKNEIKKIESNINLKDIFLNVYNYLADIRFTDISYWNAYEVSEKDLFDILTEGEQFIGLKVEDLNSKLQNPIKFVRDEDLRKQFSDKSSYCVLIKMHPNTQIIDQVEILPPLVIKEVNIQNKITTFESKDLNFAEDNEFEDYEDYEDLNFEDLVKENEFEEDLVEDKEFDSFILEKLTFELNYSNFEIYLNSCARFINNQNPKSLVCFYNKLVENIMEEYLCYCDVQISIKNL